jgi:hypothetical protein
MKKTNKFIGVLTGAALAFTVFAGTVSYVSAADAVQPLQQNYRGTGIGMHLGRTGVNMRDTIANFLGLDRSQVIAERQAGKSMVQIAKEQGKSEAELYDFVFNQRKAQIEQLVATGRISAETAAAHETIMKERIKQNMNRTEVGPNCSNFNRTKGMGNGKHKGNGQGFCVNNQ